jgi:hypothetical protein
MRRLPENLFHLLSEHLSRQDENYLTQTFAAVFTSCPSFRSELYKELHRRFRSLRVESPTALRIKTQTRLKAKDRQVIFDAVLMDHHNQIVAVFEAKLDSPEGPDQIQRYRKALKGIPLILLVRHGGDDPHVEPDLTFTWTSMYLVAEKAASHRDQSGFARSLLEGWMDFLGAKGIITPDPIKPTSWKRLLSLAQLLVGLKNDHINHAGQTLDEMRSVLARLELHRDLLVETGGWKRKGWKPYSFIFREDENAFVKGKFSSLTAGYGNPKKENHENQLEIQLYPGPPKFLVNFPRGTWIPAIQRTLKCDVTELFSLRFDEAHARLDEHLKHIPSLIRE